MEENGDGDNNTITVTMTDDGYISMCKSTTNYNH